MRVDEFCFGEENIHRDDDQDAGHHLRDQEEDRRCSFSLEFEPCHAVPAVDREEGDNDSCRDRHDHGVFQVHAVMHGRKQVPEIFQCELFRPVSDVLGVYDLGIRFKCRHDDPVDREHDQQQVECKDQETDQTGYSSLCLSGH